MTKNIKGVLPTTVWGLEQGQMAWTGEGWKYRGGGSWSRSAHFSQVLSTLGWASWAPMSPQPLAEMNQEWEGFCEDMSASVVSSPPLPVQTPGPSLALHPTTPAHTSVSRFSNRCHLAVTNFWPSCSISHLPPVRL